MLDILSGNSAVLYMNISSTENGLKKVFTVDNATEIYGVCHKSHNQFFGEEIQNFADAMMPTLYAVFRHLAYSLGEYKNSHA